MSLSKSPATSKHIRRQLDRLRQSLDGLIPADEQAGELARLQKQATAEGTTPEAVAAAAVERALPPTPSDGLRQLAGSWSAGRPDVGSRHDDHLGDALADELRGPSR